MGLIVGDGRVDEPPDIGVIGETADAWGTAPAACAAEAAEAVDALPDAADATDETGTPGPADTTAAPPAWETATPSRSIKAGASMVRRPTSPEAPPAIGVPVVPGAPPAIGVPVVPVTAGCATVLPEFGLIRPAFSDEAPEFVGGGWAASTATCVPAPTEGTDEIDLPCTATELVSRAFDGLSFPAWPEGPIEPEGLSLTVVAGPARWEGATDVMSPALGVSRR